MSHAAPRAGARPLRGLLHSTRGTLLGGLLLIAPSWAQAQAPTQAQTQGPAASPITRPADSASTPTPMLLDSTAFGRLRVGVLLQAASVRMARTGTVVPERDVALRGIDASYHFLRARYGVALRVQQSSLGGDDLSFGDLTAAYDWGLGIGLAPELGLGWRNGYEPTSGLAHGKAMTFIRPGLRASTSVGGSPLSLEMRVSRYIPVSGGGSGEEAMSGWDGETGLRWSFPHWPIDLGIGYRFERFEVYRAEQEVSSVRAEISWRRVLGRQP